MSYSANNLNQYTAVGSIGPTYDNNGNLQLKTDARGVSAHYDNDALNRPLRRWFNGSNSLSATTKPFPG